jgi:uncharacterized membrane-anchored protein
VGPTLPGVQGAARPVRPGSGDAAQATRALARRVEPGDVAVLDHLDLDRVSAEALVAAHPSAVVNVRASLSGRHPARGAEVLVAAGIPVVDATGTGLLSEVRDGGTVRVHEGHVYAGDRLLGAGTVLTAASVLAAQQRARSGMNARLEAVGADAAHFLGRHEALLLDGMGLPEVALSFSGRTVLVVGPGERAAAQARALRRWARDVRPLVVTAEDGTQGAIAAGLRPDLVVGQVAGPDHGSPATVEHVDADAIPEGLSATDLAVVLATDGDAALVVLTGSPASFDEMLDRERSAAAALLAVRLRGGERVVDAPAVLALQKPPIGLWPVLVLLAGGVAALAAAFAAVPGGDLMLHRLRDALPW